MNLEMSDPALWTTEQAGQWWPGASVSAVIGGIGVKLGGLV